MLPCAQTFRLNIHGSLRVKAEETKEEEREKRIMLRRKMKAQSHLDDTPDKVCEFKLLAAG